MDQLRTNRRALWRDSGVRCLSCTEQFRAMAFAQLTTRESLRDIEICLLANQSKLYGMDFRTPVKRSTFDAGRCQRRARLAYLGRVGDGAYLACAQIVLRRKFRYRPRQHGLRFGCHHHRPVPVVVSVGAVSFYQSGGQDAYPAGLALKVRNPLPAEAGAGAELSARQHSGFHPYLRRQDGRCQRAGYLAHRSAGAFYVMDRGYLGPFDKLRTGFTRLYVLHQAGAFFVTRAKRGMNAHGVYSMKVDRSTEIVCDQLIALDGFYTQKGYPEQLRRIRFKDPETGKALVFLTNNTTLPALTIAALYKQCWQVELFFKWIKQHLRIKRFIGNSENAVKTQIWCTKGRQSASNLRLGGINTAIATYVLIAIVKKELQIDATLYILLHILSVSVFEKTPLSQAFAGGCYISEDDPLHNQLNLFDF